MSLSEKNFIMSHKWIQHIPVLTYTDDDSSPKPLVIMSHGFTNKKEDLIPYLEELAKLGYYTVGIDNRLHGERNDGGFGMVLSEGGRLNCFKLFNAIKENAEDIRILIDYFTGDSQIDINRIGMLGISMGGFTTFKALTIDKRIKVAAPFISSPIWGDVPEGAKIDDSPEVSKAFEELSMKYSPSNTPDNFFPTAILMQAGGIDVHFNLEKLKKYYTVLKEHYQNASDRINFLVHEGVAHNVTPDMWNNAVLWLKKFL
jgi:dienelactone hydrolase